MFSVRTPFPNKKVLQKESSHQRLLLVFLWQALGRINEVTGLKWPSLKFDPKKRCLYVQLIRSKNNDQQVLEMYPVRSSNDWSLDVGEPR